MGNGPTEDIVSFGLTLFLCSVDLPRFDAIDPSDIACDARSSNLFISVIFLESLDLSSSVAPRPLPVSRPRPNRGHGIDIGFSTQISRTCVNRPRLKEMRIRHLRDLREILEQVTDSDSSWYTQRSDMSAAIA